MAKRLASLTGQLKKKPQDAPLRLKRAQLLEKLGRTNDAVGEYSKYLKLVPNDRYALAARGTLYFASNKLAKALVDFDSALEVEPRNPVSMFGRAKTLKHLFRFTEALDQYTACLKVNPAPGIYAERAELHEMMDQLPEAVADYTKALRRSPATAEYYKRRGFCHSLMQEYRRAVKDYSAAIGLAPNDPELYQWRGEQFARLDRPREAIPDFTKALALRPNDAELLELRASAYHDLACEDVPIDVEVAAAHVEVRNWTQVIADCTIALKINRKLGHCYFMRGQANDHLGRYERAIADWNSEDKLNGVSSTTAGCRARSYAAKGNYKRAVTEYSLAIKLEPEGFFVTKYVYQRGHCLQMLKKHRPAIADFDRVITKSQEAHLQPDAYYWRGFSWHCLGNQRKAKADFNRSLEVCNPPRISYEAQCKLRPDFLCP